MELIKDNYLRGTGSGQSWHVDIDPPKRKVKSYFEETLLTSEYMYANKTGKLLLMLSGGLDSEYVFRVFRHLKFDFTPVIIRLIGKHCPTDYNVNDTAQGFDLCKTYNVEPIVINFDFDEFFDSGEIFELMHKWQLEEEELIHTLLRFYQGKNLQGCPFLLSYTPEMMLSFLLDPHIVDLASGKYPGKTGTNSTKSHVFNNGSGFNMDHYDVDLAKKIVRGEVTNIKMPRYKQNGIELIVKIPHFYKKIQEIIGVRTDRALYTGCYKENYHDLVRRLSIHQ